MKNKLALTESLIQQRLEEYEEGDRPRNIDEILKIYTTLKNDRPISDFIMTTILNAMTFLHHDYPLTDPDHAVIISDFLNAFYHYSQQELLSNSSTYRDGLTMTLPDPQ